jgi:mono/diheme cytochrome c family protein
MAHGSRLKAHGLACLTASAFGLTLPLALSVESIAGHNPITTKVTWTREISPLLERRCISCHRPGGYAGFSLTTYDDARPWAVAIKEEVLSGSMPPWGAAPGIGHFANDRRLTRHEQELVAAWVDGGAPYSPEARTPAFAAATAATPNRPRAGSGGNILDVSAGSVAIPLAPATIADAIERIASVTLQLPAGMTLTAWTFEPGLASSVERVDLELGSRWLGTWTPGERWMEFPSDSGAPLATAALFTVRIGYRASREASPDRSRLRVRITKEGRPKAVYETTVVRSWRPVHSSDLLALRPARDSDDVQVVARFPDGRAEALGMLSAPGRAPHPTYTLTRPLSLPAGTRIETTAAVRLLYSTGAARTVKPNVRRRPRR